MLRAQSQSQTFLLLNDNLKNRHPIHLLGFFKLNQRKNCRDKSKKTSENKK